MGVYVNIDLPTRHQNKSVKRIEMESWNLEDSLSWTHVFGSSQHINMLETW